MVLYKFYNLINSTKKNTYSTPNCMCGIIYILRYRMIDFYYLPASVPCRAVMMLAKAIGVRLNLKIVDISKREQLKFSFIKV